MGQGQGDHDDSRTDTSNDSEQRVERGIRFVPAAPEAIFDLLADPSQHSLIDGSGTVQGPIEATSSRLTLGSKFGMSMKMGLPYKMTNEVVEYEEPRRIAWRHVGRHVWRYRLRPVDGGTEVTEEFDWSVARSPLLIRLIGAPKRNAKSIEATLDRLAAHFS